MVRTAPPPLRRSRLRRTAKRRRAALLLGFLALLGLVFALERACVRPGADAGTARIFSIESKKAVLRGADAQTVRSLSAVLQAQLGKPYVYGAAGPKAFDCSGFVQYVYARVGIKLPRVVRAQANAGETVPREDLIFGDLVFFSDGSAALTHVGIYLGDGYFVHAPSTGECVQLGGLDTEYYSAAFRLAVRVFD